MKDLQIAGVGAVEAAQARRHTCLRGSRGALLCSWRHSGVIAAVLDAAGGASIRDLPHVRDAGGAALAADRVVSFVRNYFLEYDEPEDGGKPYLGFFSCRWRGSAWSWRHSSTFAASSCSVRRIRTGHRDGERSELRSAVGKRRPGSCRGAAGAGGLDMLRLCGSRGVLLLPGRS